MIFLQIRVNKIQFIKYILTFKIIICIYIYINDVFYDSTCYRKGYTFRNDNLVTITQLYIECLDILFF